MFSALKSIVSSILFEFLVILSRWLPVVPKTVLPEKAVILGFDILLPMAEVGKFFLQGPDDIFIFMGNTVPVTSTQLCHIKAKITKDNIEIMGMAGYGLQ